MSEKPVYQFLAEAFAAEGVDTLFSLMGDGNMHFVTTMHEMPGVRALQLRHEHCACAAALGYAVATGKVGVATVTCGPGVTQLSTALATAAAARLPLVVLAGETPLNGRWHNQRIAQAPIVTATGAHYIAAHSIPRMLDSVQEAFYVARTKRQPVVLGIPYDLQGKTLPSSTVYSPASTVTPPEQRPLPRPELLDELAEKIRSSRRPIIVAGRGVMKAGAKEAVEALAEQCGALLATTLPARGLFDTSEFSVGISGGYGTVLSHKLFLEADLIIVIGASLASQTSDGGKLFRNAHVVHIDSDPLGLHHGLCVPDFYMRAEAKEAAIALADLLRRRGTEDSGYRTAEVARQIADDLVRPSGEMPEAGTLDPSEVIRRIDEVVPKDWEVVSGGGHCSFFTAQMHQRSPEHFHTIREFGAIGNGLSYAIGVAAAKPDRQVLLVEGDGGLLMHVQELETVQRHGLRILICVLNDGAYGSEVHRLRFDGIDPSCSIFGRTDFAAMAKGFGLRGANVPDLQELPALLDAYKASSGAEIWNFPISDTIVALDVRRLHAAH